MRHIIFLACVTAYSTAAGWCADASQPTAGKGAVSAEQILNLLPNIKVTKNLPNNFPVPKYTSNVTSTNFVFTTKGIPSATANINTTDSADKVFDWYKSACASAGWQIKIPDYEALKATAKRDKIYAIEGTRPKEEMTLSCLSSKKKAGTTISIRWSKTH